MGGGKGAFPVLFLAQLAQFSFTRAYGKKGGHRYGIPGSEKKGKGQGEVGPYSRVGLTLWGFPLSRFPYGGGGPRGLKTKKNPPWGGKVGGGGKMFSTGYPGGERRKNNRNKGAGRGNHG